MAVDSKKILKELAEEDAQRKPHSLWLDTKLLKEFEKACTSVKRKHTKILEKLMRDFITDVKKG